MSKIAVIMVRGFVGIDGEIREALRRLNIVKKHGCVVVEDTPSVKGAINKVKDFTTFGPIDEETYALLVEKRGEKDVEGNLKPMFRLHPPIGGFERKGIKKPFTVGGVLGNRKSAINELIKKML
ncbi:uL30 family ribosomal protein [Candidatus Woesearchaeota archaeon]|nr:uL30 family ribosomal protein [Candidatus Woesearchaeota archaeon]